MILYGTKVSDGTLTTACILATTTGGTETSAQTTFASTSNTYGEILSHGGTGTSYASAPAPTGKGWIYWPGVAGTFAAGNWSASITKAYATRGVSTTVRFYTYSGGTYTSIGSITANNTTTAKTTYSFSATAMGSVTLGTTDGIYVDLLHFDNNANVGGDNPTVYLSNSGTSGVANDMQITTTTFTLAATPAQKTLQVRALIATLNTKTLAARVRIRTLATRLTPVRALIATAPVKFLPIRALVRTQISRLIPARIVLRTQRTASLALRAVISVGNLTYKFLQIRALVSTLGNRLLSVRALIRSMAIRVVPVRALIRTITARTAPIRARIRTLNRKLLVVRAFVVNGRQKLLVVRARIRTLFTRSLVVRALIRTTNQKTLQTRARIRTGSTKLVPVRTRVRTLTARTLAVRAFLAQTKTKLITIRIRLRTRGTTLVIVRAIIATPGIAAGGFGLFANGSGIAQFDHARFTQYPDPALALGPLLPRLGTSSVSWNAVGPTPGIDISYDGITWTDISSLDGTTFPGLYSQPDPTIDGFDEDLSTHYTSTSRAGGTTGTWAVDTTSSRLVVTGGTNAIYTYTGINRADVDFFVDMDYSESGGVVWRFADPNNFYWLAINDTRCSSGTPSSVTLYKVVANSQSQLGFSLINYQVGPQSNPFFVQFVRGTYHRFRVTMLARVITISVDGVQLIQYTDTSPLAAGRLGLYNNGGTARFYQLWMQPMGDYVSGTVPGDTVTGTFVYTRQRLSTTDPVVMPQLQDITTTAFTADIGLGTIIPSVLYNHSYVSQNFDDLAKQSNYSWYIDEESVPHFQGKDATPSPWILQSAPAGLVSVVDLEVDTNLELDISNDLYRNRQTILGAVETVTAQATFIGDGSTTSFTLGYPLASAPVLYVNGVQQAVGLKGQTGYDWYYAIGDPVIEQESGDPTLTATDILTIPTYFGYVTQDITVDDFSAQATVAAIEGGSGIVEAVEDHTGEYLSVEAATTLANQLLARYAITGRTLTFMTSRPGLEIGQTLTIFLPEHGIIDQQFFLTQVEIKLQKDIGDTQVWWFKVTASELPRQASWTKIIASGLRLS